MLTLLFSRRQEVRSRSLSKGRDELRSQVRKKGDLPVKVKSKVKAGSGGGMDPNGNPKP